MSRITFNANVSEIGDIQKFVNTLKVWRPSWVVLMNSLGSANFQAIADAVRSWNGHIIYRHYEQSDGHLWRSRTVDEHFRLLSSFSALYPDVWWYVSNEPLPGNDERQRMMDWHAALIDKCAAAGIRLCVGNFATAAMSSTKADIDGGRWDTLLRKFGEHADRRVSGEAQILMGVHTYGHALIPWHCAGRSPDDLDNPTAIVADKWPTTQDVQTTPEDNWLIFREDWFVQRIKALTGKTVDVAVTEYGWDRMPNIVKDWSRVAQSVDKLAQMEVRGLPTLIHYFDAISPAPWHLTACKQLAWTEQIYPPNYRCFALFTWSHNREWKAGYDVSGLDAFLQAWPTYTQPQAPTLPDNENPETAKEAIAVIGGATVNIRSRPSITGDIVGAVKNGERVTVFDHKPDGTNTVWVQIERKGYDTIPTRKGWISSNLVKLDYHIDDVGEMVSPTDHAKVIAERDAARAEVSQLMAEIERMKAAELARVAMIANHFRRAKQSHEEHSAALSKAMAPLLNLSNALDDAATLLTGQTTNGEKVNGR